MDMKLLNSFVEFYTTFLGFVNFKLFQSINIHYPPQVPFRIKGSKLVSEDEILENYISSLNTTLRLANQDVEDEEEEDHIYSLMVSKKNLTKGFK